MVHDYCKRQTATQRPRAGRSENQWRTIVQRILSSRVRVCIGCCRMRLGNIDDAYARLLDKKANIYPPDVITFDQVRRIVRIRETIETYRIIIDLSCHSLQGREILHLLDADDVRITLHGANNQRGLRYSAIEGCRCEDRITGAGIV